MHLLTVTNFKTFTQDLKQHIVHIFVKKYFQIVKMKVFLYTLGNFTIFLCTRGKTKKRFNYMLSRYRCLKSD